MSPIKNVDLGESTRSMHVCPHREDLQRWRSHAGLDGGEVQNTQWGGWTTGEGEPDGQKTFILKHPHVYRLDSDFKILIFPLPCIIYSEGNWTAFIVSGKGENLTSSKKKKYCTKGEEMQIFMAVGGTKVQLKYFQPLCCNRLCTRLCWVLPVIWNIFRVSNNKPDR